ncbi:hypothetical protein [Rhodococcus sp. Q]|nr:hypothetical protein [Rhodococcus sp. Q]
MPLLVAEILIVPVPVPVPVIVRTIIERTVDTVYGHRCGDTRER